MKQLVIKTKSFQFSLFIKELIIQNEYINYNQLQLLKQRIQNNKSTD